MSIKILIADDHPIFRQGLVKIIEAKENFELIVECADGNSALQKIRDLKPHIAVLDISMPGLSGLEVARVVQGETLSTKIVILTMYKEEEYFQEAMSLGIKGYLLKENAISDLYECLIAVNEDRHFISSLLSDYLIRYEQERKTLKSETRSLESLTPMERTILKKIADNKTSKEIAQELYISYRTVQNHRQHISEKLDLHGPHKLLQFALEHKFLL